MCDARARTALAAPLPTTMPFCVMHAQRLNADCEAPLLRKACHRGAPTGTHWKPTCLPPPSILRPVLPQPRRQIYNHLVLAPSRCVDAVVRKEQTYNREGVGGEGQGCAPHRPTQSRAVQRLPLGAATQSTSPPGTVPPQLHAVPPVGLPRGVNESAHAQRLA